MNKILFVPGLARCSTTTLVNILAQHPDIFLPKVKEPHFFMPNKKELYSFNSRGTKIPFKKNGFINTWRDYVANFKNFEKHQVFIDGSTLYSGYLESLERIKCNQDIDPYFIIMKRDPFKRAISHYLYSKSRGEEFREFDKALEDEISNKYPNWILKGYLNGSNSLGVEQKINLLWGNHKRLNFDLEEGNVYNQENFDKILVMLDLPPYQFDFDRKKNSLVFTDNKLLFQLRLLAKKIRQISPFIFDNKVSRKLFENLILKKMNSNPDIYKKYENYKGVFYKYYKH